VEVHPHFEALRTAPTSEEERKRGLLSSQLEGTRSVDGSMQQRHCGFDVIEDSLKYPVMKPCLPA
jgi:hypothetical protein